MYISETQLNTQNSVTYLQKTKLNLKKNINPTPANSKNMHKPLQIFTAKIFSVFKISKQISF